MRLTESNEKVVKVHPLPVEFFSRGLFSVDRIIGDKRNEVEADRDENLPEVFVFDCDGFESRGNPYDGRFSRPECHFFEFLRFREVDRSRR